MFWALSVKRTTLKQVSSRALCLLPYLLYNNIFNNGWSCLIPSGAKGYRMEMWFPDAGGKWVFIVLRVFVHLCYDRGILNVCVEWKYQCMLGTAKKKHLWQVYIIIIISAVDCWIDDHSWTKATPNVLHTERSCAFLIQWTPASFTRSSVHLEESSRSRVQEVAAKVTSRHRWLNIISAWQKKLSI